MKIVILADNRVKESNLKSEHGLSVYVETCQHKILFDTGQSDFFEQNARKLKIDLSKVDLAVISHGHYDHLGGLIYFLKQNSKAKVIMKREIFNHQYYSVRGEEKKHIGYQKELKEYIDRFYFLDDQVTTINNLHFIKDIEHRFPMPKGNNILFKSDGKNLVPDDFKHELLFVIDSHDGMIIFTGCAHNGVLNMVETTKKHFPNRKIKMIFGGFHLIDKNNFTDTENESDLSLFVKKLNEMTKQETLIYSGHCTGDEALADLSERTEINFMPFYTGFSVEV